MGRAQDAVKKTIAIAKVVFQYGFIPGVVYLGELCANTDSSLVC